MGSRAIDLDHGLRSFLGDDGLLISLLRSFGQVFFLGSECWNSSSQCYAGPRECAYVCTDLFYRAPASRSLQRLSDNRFDVMLIPYWAISSIVYMRPAAKGGYEAACRPTRLHNEGAACWIARLHNEGTACWSLSVLDCPAGLKTSRRFDDNCPTSAACGAASHDQVLTKLLVIKERPR